MVKCRSEEEKGVSMKDTIYYRYYYNNKSIFLGIAKWFNQQSRIRHGSSVWLEEHKEWTRKINNSIKWLPEPELKKGCKSYFKKLGDKKYQKTLLKIHRKILNPKRIIKRKFICFEKNIGKKRFLYNLSTKKKIGEIVYEDKYQTSGL